MSEERSNPKASPWRMRIGSALFALGLGSPVFVPLVTALPLSIELRTLLSGLFVLGIPEVLWLAAAAVLGRDGFGALKTSLFGWIRELGPPATVSPARYRVGICLFTLPLLLALLQPYAELWIDAASAHRLALGIIGDVCLATSLLVLGGDFWDKLRALFLHDARARFEPSANS